MCWRYALNFSRSLSLITLSAIFQAYERMNLADALVPKHFADGEQIIKQGDIADGMYFVEQGVVRITILGDDGREVEVSFTTS